MIGSLRRESPLRDAARDVLVNRYHPLVRSRAGRSQDSRNRTRTRCRPAPPAWSRRSATSIPRQARAWPVTRCPASAATSTGTSATSAGRFRSAGPCRTCGSLRAPPPPSSARRMADRRRRRAGGAAGHLRGRAARGQARRTGIPVSVAGRPDHRTGRQGQPRRPDRRRGPSARAAARHGGGLEALAGLPGREQQLLLRFCGKMTQAELGKHPGISQCTSPGSTPTLLVFCASVCRPRVAGK
jgi:hypothetical protein